MISNLSQRPRAAIGHPYLGRGGSETKVMWLIEALKDRWDVDLITTGGWNLDELNRAYGTAVEDGDVRVRIAPGARLLGRCPAAALRAGLFQRFCRTIAAEYDLRLSAYNGLDWGLPAIHFIADFSWDREVRERFDPPSPGLIYRDSLLRRAYLSLGRALARPSGRDLYRDDTVVANSEWTAGLMESRCGRRPPVIYPPVPGELPTVPWERKEPAFVCLGRIDPEKRVERVVAILGRVRERHPELKLHVIGGLPETPYARGMRDLFRSNASWVVHEGAVYGAAKTGLLGRFRYGLHACGREAFGIAVAELAKAGAVVFAPAEGGQAEILGDEALLYRDEDEAVAKILRVLESESEQARLRALLAERVGRFTAAAFVKAVREMVDQQGVPEENSPLFPVGKGGRGG